MIRNAQVGCRLWVARNTLVDVSICDAVDLPDARPGSLRWIRLSPLGRGHAASVEGGVGRLRAGDRPPPEGRPDAKRVDRPPVGALGAE